MCVCFVPKAIIFFTFILILSPLSFWTLPYLNLDTSAFWSKINNRMAKSIDPDETARRDPSHQNLHCLQRYLLRSEELKGLSQRQLISP